MLLRSIKGGSTKRLIEGNSGIGNALEKYPVIYSKGNRVTSGRPLFANVLTLEKDFNLRKFYISLISLKNAVLNMQDIKLNINHE